MVTSTHIISCISLLIPPGVSSKRILAWMDHAFAACNAHKYASDSATAQFVVCSRANADTYSIARGSITTSPATATATAAAAARAARGTPGLGVTAQAHAATIPHAGSHAWTAMLVTACVGIPRMFPLVTRAHAKALVAAYDAATSKAAFSAPFLTFSLNSRKPSGLAEKASASLPDTITDATRHTTDSAMSEIDGASYASKASSKPLRHACATAPTINDKASGITRFAVRLNLPATRYIIQGVDSISASFPSWACSPKYTRHMNSSPVTAASCCNKNANANGAAMTIGKTTL